MNLDRFEALAEAFGGRLSHWPQEDQAQAAILLADDPRAAAVLAAASDLDWRLDDWTLPPPSPELRAQVLLRAPKAPPVSGRWVWVRQAAVWTSGAGLIAAGLAGVVCGSAISTAALTDARDQALVASATTAGLGPFNSAGEEIGSRVSDRPRPAS